MKYLIMLNNCIKPQNVPTRLSDLVHSLDFKQEIKKENKA